MLLLYNCYERRYKECNSISYSQRASLSDVFSCSFVSNGNKSVQKWVKLSCKIVYLHKFFYFLDSDKKNLGKEYENGGMKWNMITVKIPSFTSTIDLSFNFLYLIMEIYITLYSKHCKNIKVWREYFKNVFKHDYDKTLSISYERWKMIHCIESVTIYIWWNILIMNDMIFWYN